MRFTLRQLQYFVAAAEAGSVTDAALNIPVSQSSVSAAISQLEAALGVQLLIRHHAQGISPTAEGYIGNITMILDLADPAHPKEVGRWWIPGQWQAGGEAYPWGDGVTPRCQLAIPLQFA